MNYFNENSGDIIPEQLAKKWIENYKNRAEYTPIDSMYFGGKLFLKILSLPHVIGIRIHNAVDDDGVFHILLTGVNKKGENVYIPYNTGNTSTEKSLDGGGGEGAGEGGIPCPGGGCP